MLKHVNTQAYLFEGELAFNEQDLKLIFADKLEGFKAGGRPDVIKAGTFEGYTSEEDIGNGVFTDEFERKYPIQRGKVAFESNFEWFDFSTAK